MPPHGSPTAGSVPKTWLCRERADIDIPQTAEGSLSLAAAHLAQSPRSFPATAIASLTKYQC